MIFNFFFFNCITNGFKKKITKYIKSRIFGTALKVLRLPMQGTDGITNVILSMGRWVSQQYKCWLLMRGREDACPGEWKGFREDTCSSPGLQGLWVNIPMNMLGFSVCSASPSEPPCLLSPSNSNRKDPISPDQVQGCDLGPSNQLTVKTSITSVGKRCSLLWCWDGQDVSLGFLRTIPAIPWGHSAWERCQQRREQSQETEQGLDDEVWGSGCSTTWRCLLESSYWSRQSSFLFL